MMFSKNRESASPMMPIILGCVLAIGGCQSDPEQETLFDHDHEQPAHWPHDLGDVSHMIRDRIEKLDSDQEPIVTELFDLVSWAPEIAADTSISEQQWDPIYEASESLRLSLIDSGNQWDQEDRQEAEKLCVMVDTAWSQIPENEKQAAEERREALDHDHEHHHGDDHHDEHEDGHHDDHGDEHDEDHGDDHHDEHDEHDDDHHPEDDDHSQHSDDGHDPDDDHSDDHGNEREES